MHTRRLFICFVLITSRLLCAASGEIDVKQFISTDKAPPKVPLEVGSPNGAVKANVDTDQLELSVELDGKEVIRRSRLGLGIKDEREFEHHMTVLSVERHSIDETWRPVAGKVSEAHTRANEMTIRLLDYHGLASRRLDLVVRAYDEGIAFRYVIPEKEGIQFTSIIGDLTEFQFPEDATCWYADYQHFNTSQEANFVAGTLSTIPFEALLGMPLLVKAREDVYIALTEADVTGWAGSRFYVAGKEVFIGGPEGAKGPGVAIGMKLAPDEKEHDPHYNYLPAQSPWRVVMIGRTPGDLIQSNLIENLNPPSEVKDTSWIKPGIAAWDWWSGRSRMETDSIKKFIQLAADMGWPYTLIDAGWYYHEDQPDGDLLRVSDGLDMDEVRRFAKEKGVRLWLWMSWRDVMRNDAYKKAFPLFEQWGIAGLKIDFMNREDQWMVDWYHQMFRETAEHHLMLDLHGAYKPTGARRTWPNFITQEGVLGNEYNRGGREATARHNVTIPYTRGLLGPMDYTPGGFVNQTPGQFQPTEHGTTVPNTRGQELAKFVVFESPLMMACDYPDNYCGQPGADFLKVVKTSWDEVRWLSGEVGESVVLARRSGDEWFVGGMTNEDARKVRVKLGFLRGGKRYKATVWKDAPEADQDATKLVKEEREVGAEDEMEVAMAPAGGFVVRLVPVGE